MEEIWQEKIKITDYAPDQGTLHPIPNHLVLLVRCLKTHESRVMIQVRIRSNQDSHPSVSYRHPRGRPTRGA